MAVQVWIGEKPEHPNERRAIVALANSLQQLEGLYLILANFSVGGRTVDLVIIKHDAIFILELKHCDGRVIGSVNGPWLVEGRNGEQKRLNPGRKNPYNQVISYFHALTNFLNEHRREFLSVQKANDVDFRTCKRAVVIAPAIQEDSEIELDWKVELKGLDELPAYLITERSSEIELTDEEMLAIPYMLHCTPWQEINTVLRGVVSDGEQLPQPTATTVHKPTTADAPPVTPSDPIDQAGHSIRPIYALGATLLTFGIIFALVLFLRPLPTAPTPDALGPMVEVTGIPAGDPLPSVLPDMTTNCQWSGYQLVGKRYDADSQSWVSIAESGGATVATPEIVIAIEQISTCDGTIELTWSLRNNWDRPVEFPLQGDNIRISDGLGNDYPLDDSASTPTILIVDPGNQDRGATVANRPLSRSATSLLVRVRNQPFGEASFVVALQP